MPQGLYNTSGAPLIGPNSQAGSDALKSLYNPQRRGLMDFVHPADSSAIQAIQQAIGAGLDPSTAMGLLANVAGGVTDRFDTFKTNRADARNTATDALMQLAQTNPNPEAASTYTDAWSQLHPGMAGQVAPTLDQLSQSLYPGGETSPLYSGDAGGGAVVLTPDDISGVYQDAITFAQGDPQQGVPGIPLHDARMRIMTQLRAQGYSEADLAKAYDVIGGAYQAVGGNINAPLNSQDRLAAMAQQQAPGASPVSQQPQGISAPVHESLLDKIRYAIPGLGG